MTSVFGWLTSLGVIISGSIHIAANGIISLFSWLSSIPLCGCVCVCVCERERERERETSLSIHLSTDTSSCSPTLVTVNGAATNKEVHASFRIKAFPEHMPRIEVISTGLVTLARVGKD